jgi:hypothetical protein
MRQLILCLVVLYQEIERAQISSRCKLESYKTTRTLRTGEGDFRKFGEVWAFPF